MRRFLSSLAGTIAIATLSASVVLAGGGVSGVAKGHGQAVSEVANAVDYVSGKARGEAVSALAKQHGAIVSAAAKAQHGVTSPAGKDKGTEASGLKGGNAAEPGGLKGAAGG